MVAFLLVTAAYAIAYVPVSILIEYRSALVAIPIAAVACILLSFALRAGTSMVVVCNIYLLVLSVLISFMWVTTGGIISSPNDPAFSALYPVIALLLLGRRWAFAWLGIAVVLVVGNGIPGLMGIELSLAMNPDWAAPFFIISLVGHAAVLFVFVNMFETSRDNAHKQMEAANEALEVEQEKTEGLLLNILPAEVAEELKSTGQSEAREHELVTILLSDFKNFTGISEKMSPRDLARELNECFFAFDEIVERHHLEKIKTIGDAYMAAAGLPGDHPTDAADMVRAAVEMQLFLTAHNAENAATGRPFFSMRIGIHTGPVVTGIVGWKKFQYDIWGDTVNTAARIESSGEVGLVNISGATYALVQSEPDLSFTPRGKVAAKGKGELEMYFVEVSVSR